MHEDVGVHLVESTNMITNLVEILEPDTAGAPGTNPFLVELMILKDHDGLDAVPFRQAGDDAEATLLGSGGHVVMNQAKAIRWRKVRGDRCVRDRREVGRG
jgi:hypothetical protein